MILHLGFDICVEADNGHEVRCTIVQELGTESKLKRVQNPSRRLRETTCPARITGGAPISRRYTKPGAVMVLF